MEKIKTELDTFIKNFKTNIKREYKVLKDAFAKETDPSFEHAIDGFEAFVNLCKNPEYLFQILHIITPPEKGVKNRVFREILKSLSSITEIMSY